MAKRPPRSKLGRLARLSGLTSRVGSSYLGQRMVGVFQDEEIRHRALSRLHLQNAERVVDTMGTLKGAAMKVGQSLAVVMDGVEVPPEVSRILSKLHDSAQPIPFEDIRATIEEELERPLEEAFLSFDEEPLGAASLAQAHAAQLPDGTQVVVKALYTGIEDSVDSDLSALRSLLVTSRMLRRDPAEVHALFEEVRTRLHEELDYYQEAAHLEEFHAAYQGVEGISIPRTHPSHCTGRVLTMDRLTGQSAEDFAAQASPEARQRAGDLLIRTFYDMIYRLRALHADPHGGNYLFRPDGSVGIIDFGCVKRFDMFWIAHYSEMVLGILDHDMERAMSRAMDVGVLSRRDPEAEVILQELVQTICRPVMTPHYTCGGAEDDVTARTAKIVPQILLHPALKSHPNLVFLHRSLAGIYTLLRKLRHSHDYGTLLRRHAEHAMAVAAGEIEDGAPVRLS